MNNGSNAAWVISAALFGLAAMSGAVHAEIATFYCAKASGATDLLTIDLEGKRMQWRDDGGNDGPWLPVTVGGNALSYDDGKGAKFGIDLETGAVTQSGGDEANKVSKCEAEN